MFRASDRLVGIGMSRVKNFALPKRAVSFSRVRRSHRFASRSSSILVLSPHPLSLDSALLSPPCRPINLLVSLSLSTNILTFPFPDRTAKTVGITQGPPDFAPLDDFERYANSSPHFACSRVCADNHLDRKGIYDVQRTVLTAHYLHGPRRNSNSSLEDLVRLC